MSSARPQFSIDDAFDLSLEDAGPGPEASGVARFGPLHFDRRARFEGPDEEKQSRLRYQVKARPGPARLHPGSGENLPTTGSAEPGSPLARGSDPRTRIFHAPARSPPTDTPGPAPGSDRSADPHLGAPQLQTPEKLT